MFSCKLLQGVSIRLEDIDSLFHSINLLLIDLDLLFLTFDFQTGLSPVDPRIARTDDPDENKDGGADSKENPEILMLSLEYVSKLAQNRTD